MEADLPGEDPARPDVDESTRETRSRPGKFVLFLTLAPLIGMTIAANIANAFFPTLLEHHPLTLVMFDPRTRNLLLVTAKVAFIAWFVAALIRRVIFDPLYFLLGRWYGDAGVRWLEKRSPDLGALLTKIEEWFPRFGPLLVAIYPHPLVCVMAGASAMRMWAFVAYNTLGNIVILAVVWQVGETAERPVAATTSFISKYSLPLTVVSFVLVAYYLLRNKSEGHSPIESVGRMEQELEDESRRDDR